jgi:hypothetical protein
MKTAPFKAGELLRATVTDRDSLISKGSHYLCMRDQVDDDRVDVRVSSVIGVSPDDFERSSAPVDIWPEAVADLAERDDVHLDASRFQVYPIDNGCSACGEGGLYGVKDAFDADGGVAFRSIEQAREVRDALREAFKVGWWGCRAALGDVKRDAERFRFMQRLPPWSMGTGRVLPSGMWILLVNRHDKVTDREFINGDRLAAEVDKRMMQESIAAKEAARVPDRKAELLARARKLFEAIEADDFDQSFKLAEDISTLSAHSVLSRDPAAAR